MKYYGLLTGIVLVLCSVGAKVTFSAPYLPFEDFGHVFTDKSFRNQTLLDLTDHDKIVFAKEQYLSPHNFDQNGEPEDWPIEEEYKGYTMKSDGLPISVKTLRVKSQKKIKPMVRIRLGKVGSARYVEGKYRRRVLELKITSWDREHRFRIRVPFGQRAQDLQIMEGAKYVDIYAPVSLVNPNPN